MGGGEEFFSRALPPPRKIWNGAPDYLRTICCVFLSSCSSSIYSTTGTVKIEIHHFVTLRLFTLDTLRNGKVWLSLKKRLLRCSKSPQNFPFSYCIGSSQYPSLLDLNAQACHELKNNKYTQRMVPWNDKV